MELDLNADTSIEFWRFLSDTIVEWTKGDFVLAKDSYDRGARLYASIGNRRAEARTLTNKALVLQRQGDLEAHLETLHEHGNSFAWLAVLNDRHEVVAATVNLNPTALAWLQANSAGRIIVLASQRPSYLALATRTLDVDTFTEEPAS